MLLRMFVLLYDTEVVEEEAFLKWKEDVSEKYPGKGKALFQVGSVLCSRYSFIAKGHVTRGNVFCNLQRNDEDCKTLQVALDMLHAAINFVSQRCEE